MADFGADWAYKNAEMQRARANDFFNRLYTQQGLNQQKREQDWKMNQPADFNLKDMAEQAAYKAKLYGVQSLSPQEQAAIQAQDLSSRDQTYIDTFGRMQTMKAPSIWDRLNPSGSVQQVVDQTSSAGTFAPEYGPSAPSPAPVQSEPLDGRVLPTPKDSTFDMFSFSEDLPTVPPEGYTSVTGTGLPSVAGVPSPDYAPSPDYGPYQAPMPYPGPEGQKAAGASELNMLEDTIKRQRDFKDEINKEQRAIQNKRNNPMDYNDGQTSSANFANMMVESQKIIGDLLKTKPSAGDAKTGTTGKVAAFLKGVPIFGALDSAAEGMVYANATPEQQQYLNAATAWIRAKLRKESGAVISKDEIENEYNTFFPTAMDSGAVIQQKARLREEATKAMIQQSAGAYQLQYGKKAQAQTQTNNGWSIKRLD